MILRAGAKVNITNNNRETPLHWAARVGDVEIVQLLVDYGASINAQVNIFLGRHLFHPVPLGILDIPHLPYLCRVCGSANDSETHISSLLFLTWPGYNNLVILFGPVLSSLPSHFTLLPTTVLLLSCFARFDYPRMTQVARHSIMPSPGATPMLYTAYSTRVLMPILEISMDVQCCTFYALGLSRTILLLLVLLELLLWLMLGQVGVQQW